MVIGVSFLAYKAELTTYLSQKKIFISVFNQLDAQNLFYSKFYFMPLHVLSTCGHHQEVKIALHSLWYHHIISEWFKITKIQFYKYEQIVVKFLCVNFSAVITVHYLL